jgi:1-acyl-sn-glycerol-3-phosphate acyltransferase
MTDTSSQTTSYNHARLESRRKLLRFLLKYIGFTFLAKIDRVEGIENVPERGPAIIMINHINFIDPFVVLNLLPRNIGPLAKIEVYDYPVVGIFPKIWGVIPVHREETDRHAIQQVLEVLKAGEIILVAPEGTRSPQLQQGRVGVAYMASRGQAPVVPVAISDTTGFPTLPFKSRWKGPGAHVRFGRPFRFRAQYRHARHEKLRKMTDEAMYTLASMLPLEQRGVYSDLSQVTHETIDWM